MSFTKSLILIRIFIIIFLVNISLICKAADSYINTDNEYDMILGNKDAKLTIIEYFSPTCYYCADFKENLFPKLKQKYIDSGKVKYIIRPLIDSRIALDATLLAYSGSKENFIHIMNDLMQNQDKWLDSKEYFTYFVHYAKKLGIDKFYNEYLQNENFKEGLVRISYNLYRESEIIGVPSFIINGKLFEDDYDFKNFSSAIDKELGM